MIVLTHVSKERAEVPPRMVSRLLLSKLLAHGDTRTQAQYAWRSRGAGTEKQGACVHAPAKVKSTTEEAHNHRQEFCKVFSSNSDLGIHAVSSSTQNHTHI